MSSSHKFDSANSSNKCAKKFAEFRFGYTMNLLIDGQTADDEMLVDDKKEEKWNLYDDHRHFVLFLFFSFFVCFSPARSTSSHRLREIIRFAQVNSMKFVQWEFGFHAYYLPIHTQFFWKTCAPHIPSKCSRVVHMVQSFTLRQHLLFWLEFWLPFCWFVVTFFFHLIFFFTCLQLLIIAYNYCWWAQWFLQAIHLGNLWIELYFIDWLFRSVSNINKNYRKTHIWNEIS